MENSAPFQKIVVPLDGSREAERALPHAEQIARGGGSELILLHVYKPAGMDYTADAALAQQMTHIEQARHNAEQYVKGLRSRIASRNINVRTQLVESNDFPQSVCQFVESEGADVVVMRASHHSHLVNVLLGDATQRVSGCVQACLLLVRGD